MEISRNGQGTAENDAVLLLDTCGERSWAAVLRTQGQVLAEYELAPRSAVSELGPAIRSVLQRSGLGVGNLLGVGVMSGPGSFTGLRVGLATAKGLCEAAALPMAAVSRLAVLAGAAPAGAVCCMSAGRSQVYLCGSAGTAMAEQSAGEEDLRALCGGRKVISDTPTLAARLQASGADGGTGQTLEVLPQHMLRPVLEQLAGGGADVALTDANYVRDEGAIYRMVGKGGGS